MTPKLQGRKKAGFVVASVLAFGWVQVALAATPVAVTPVTSPEMMMGKPGSLVQFTLGVGAGYLTGESTELVYWPQYGNHKASELTWEIDSLFMVGLEASMKVGKWFTANFDGWFKATDGDGTMDDYDWLVRGQEWSDWSHHEDTDVTDGSIIDINGVFSFWRPQNVTFNAIVGYKRDNFGWEARGGEYIYSVSGFRDSSGSFPSGAKAISYEQTMSSFYFGLGIDLSVNKFHLDSRIIYSPIVQAEATDVHHFRNLYTYDDFDNGDMIAFDLTGSYDITDHFAVELGYSYQNYDTVQGDSEWQYRNQGAVILYRDGAGMDQQSSLLSFALQYTF